MIFSATGKCNFVLLLAWFGILTNTVVAQPTPQKADSVDQNYRDELPRIPARSPAEAMKAFHVIPGFRIEQVAAEPLVADPIAMSFDESGRLFVVEMIDYSEDDKAFLGGVQLLQDTDGDGKFDKSTTFADGLS